MTLALKLVVDLPLTYERIHENVQNSVTIIQNEENPKLLVIENTISSISSLSFILSQKQLFKLSLFVKN